MSLILAFLFLFPAKADAFQVAGGFVCGRVRDGNSGEALAGVHVIYGKGQGTNTDGDGYYVLKTTLSKPEIRFQFLGYEPVTRTLSLNDGDTLHLDIYLIMKPLEINQVVVSASRTEQKIAETTVSMNIVNPSLLTGNHITDAQELIGKTSGIEVLDGQASVRGGSGFSYGAGSRVLALVDGLPMISADAGNIKWQFLPLENLSQVEILKGASSVLYGSSALNGVINFRTADATVEPVTRFHVETGIYDKPVNRKRVWWDTPRVYSGVSFSHLKKHDKNDMGISLYLLEDEGYRRLNQEKLGRVSFKLKHYNSKVEGLTYGVCINSGYTEKKDFVLWENADSGALKQSPTTALEFHGTHVSADPFISYRKNNSSRHDLRARVQVSLNRLPESEQNNSDSYSEHVEYQLWHTLYKFMDITAGISEDFSIVKSYFFNNHEYLNVAGYAQLEIRPFNRLKGVAGVRSEYYSLDGSGKKVIPVFRAGLNWQAARFTFLRASFGQGYRYPSVAEKFAATTLGSVKIIANPDILPESGWSSEVGMKQALAIGRLTGQVDFSLFYTRNSNLIEYMFASYPEGIGFRATNREESRVYGSEFEFVVTRASGMLNMTLSGGYTFIYPAEVNPLTSKNTGNYLKYRRMHSANINLQTGWKRFETGLGIYYKSRILDIDDVFLTTSILPGFPGYWAGHNTAFVLLDGSLAYSLTGKMRVSLVVKNISNTEYMGRPGDIQPQREFSLRLSGTF
jgi:iron complex outermembrane receptor protein